MSSDRSPINAASYQSALNHRIGQAEGHLPLEFDSKNFAFELAFEHDLYAGDEIPIIKPIVFKNCAFLEKVTIPVHRKAGNIVFVDCIFEKQVMVHSLDNVEFRGEKISTILQRYAREKAILP